MAEDVPQLRHRLHTGGAALRTCSTCMHALPRSALLRRAGPHAAACLPKALRLPGLCARHLDLCVAWALVLALKLTQAGVPCKVSPARPRTRSHQIKADAEGAAGRSYNYRVVMHTGGAELDMRGRCSAGQKVRENGVPAPSWRPHAARPDAGQCRAVLPGWHPSPPSPLRTLPHITHHHHTHTHTHPGAGLPDHPAGAGRDLLPQLRHPCAGRTHYEPGCGCVWPLPPTLRALLRWHSGRQSPGAPAACSRRRTAAQRSRTRALAQQNAAPPVCLFGSGLFHPGCYKVPSARAAASPAGVLQAAGLALPYAPPNCPNPSHCLPCRPSPRLLQTTAPAWRRRCAPSCRIAAIRHACCAHAQLACALCY